jgi:simple sugar transport system substrate-binding protein
MLHNTWTDAASTLQRETYCDVAMVGHRVGMSNGVKDSDNTAIDQMRAIPELKGSLIFGANGPTGAGRAVVECEAVGKVAVVEPFIPGQGIDLMKKGAIMRGILWNPIDAGYLMVQLGKLLADGVEVTEGMDIPGLGPAPVEAEIRAIRANKMLDINSDTISGFAGLI